MYNLRRSQRKSGKQGIARQKKCEENRARQLVTLISDYNQQKIIQE